VLCSAGKATAQKAMPAVTANYRQASLTVILNDLEKQSGLRFYYDAATLDSSRFDLQVTNEPIDHALTLLFQKSPMQFSIDGDNNVFITRDQPVQTNLPENFFDPTVKLARRDSLTNYSDRTRKTEPTTLENKLHVIGAAKNNKQRVTITGNIQNSKTGEALSGAVVFLDNSDVSAVTDQYGYYTLSMPKGRHTLTIKSIAMKQTKRQVLAQDDGKLDISLQEEIMTLSNVLVRADKTNQVRSLQMGMQKLDQQMIKQVPVVFGEADVLRVAMTLPGVKTVGEASTGLNVRGGSADQNLILFNDATIYNPSHFFGLFSAFNAETVKDIQLYKSGIPVKYGGRLSSVLEVNSREGNKKIYTGSAGIGAITSRFNIEGPLVKDKSSFLLGARTTYANWLLNQLPQEYKKSVASFYDVNFNTSHQLDSNNSLYLMGYVSHDGFNLNSDTAYSYGNRNFSAKWKHIFNTRWNSLLTAGYDHYQYGISSDGTPSKAYQLNFDINQYYLRAHANYFASATHSFEMGISSLLYKLHPGSYQPTNSRSTVTPQVMEPEQALENAVYFSDRYKISNEFNLETGIRYTVYSYLGAKTVNYYAAGVPKSDGSRTGTQAYNSGAFINTYHGPEFRITARYAFNNDLSVKAGFNTQKQFIQMLSNTAAMAPTDIWKLSDPNIKPENAMQFSLGLYKNFNGGDIETSIETYYKRMTGFLDYKSGAQLILNPHIETDVVSTKGQAYGVEILLKKSVGKLNGWLSYTYSRTLLQMNDSSQGPIVNGGKWYAANYDKPHDITWAGNYHISHRYSISWNLTYSTGRPITLPIGRFDYAGGGRTLYAERNANRIPDYMRADFAITLDGNHKLEQRFHNSFTIGAYNLTGRKNPYSVYYVSEGGAINGYKFSIFGNIIPYINYNIRF
jgi:hypothetical protein